MKVGSSLWFICFILAGGASCGDDGATGTDAATEDASPTGGDDGGLADAAPPLPLESWILTLDNSADNTGHHLARVSIAEADYGTVTTVCADVVLPSSSAR